MTAEGVAGGKSGSPRASLPMLKGLKQSMSLLTSMVLMTARVRDVLGEGAQRQDARYRLVGVEALDYLDDAFLGHVGGGVLVDVVEARFLAELLHLAAVHVGAEVVADQQGGDARGDPLGLECLGLGDDLLHQLVADGYAVYHQCHMRALLSS